MNANQRSSSSAEFFVAGGTLPASAPSYVRRPADEQLFEAAAASRFCYVLTTRQMGKSSLMVRTARRLKQQGVSTAIIDLTTMGGKTEETWYLDFLTELSDQLGVEQDVEAWWQERATLGAVRRFSNFLRDVVLEEISDQIVIFIDEIDFTLGLPFADDFFAAVRATYNARALDAKFNRLTFIFLGVAAPADLIKDRTRTPFNIGEGIVLRDFDRTDAAVLQQGLETAYPGQGQAILDRVFYWTAGHPYLTQKLCREVVEAKRTASWTDAEVDRVVNDLFLSDQTNREQNLQFVQDRVLKNPRHRELLKLYGKVRTGKAVANDEQSVLQNQLKLAGLVISNDGSLRVHNEIYSTVFDTKWIKINTPRDSNRLVTYTAIVVAVLVVGLAGFVLWFNSNIQHQAEQLQLEFAQASTAADRLDRLARLFELQGIFNATNFDDVARQEFFTLKDRQAQLDLLQVQDPRIVSVIKGLYTALADVDNPGENDALLVAMKTALEPPTNQSSDVVRLHDEIALWWQARQSAQQGSGLYDKALADYSKAIDLNDDNPATHYERAKLLLKLQPPLYSQASSDLDTVIAAARKVSQSETSEQPAVITPTLTESAATPTPLTISTALPKTPSSTTQAKPIVTASATRLPTAAATVVAAGQTPSPLPAATNQPPRVDAQRPFRSDFINFVQIASAVKRLIDSNPQLVGFLAGSTESDFGNLWGVQLVRTLTPTPTLAKGATTPPPTSAVGQVGGTPVATLALPISSGRIGLHVIAGNRTGFGDFLLQTASSGVPIPVVVAVNEDVFPDIQRFSPQTLVVFRDSSLSSGQNDKFDPFNPDGTLRDPVEVAQQYFDQVNPVWSHVRANYYETPDEISGQWVWESAFYNALMEVAEAHGYKLALDLSATADLAVSDTARAQEAAKALLPTLQRAKANGHILSLHEFSDIGAQLQTPQALRHRSLYEDILIPNKVDLPLVLTVGEENNLKGQDVGRLIDDLAWYNSEIEKDNYVIGAAVWTLGGDSSINLSTVLPRLADYISAHPAPGATTTVTPDAVTELLRRTNALRADNKRSPYTLNTDLNQVALAHSQDMANRDQLTHTGADGSTAAQRITNAGYGAGQPAENIYGGQKATVDDAWAFWTTDPPHLANLLNEANTDIGIGVVEGKTNTYYTIVFGKPAPSVAITPQILPTNIPVPTPQASSASLTIGNDPVNLLDHAPLATWTNGSGQANLWLDSYPTAKDNVSSGFAVYVPKGFTLETGDVVQGDRQVVQTHPEFKANGEIHGTFPLELPPQGADLFATLAFLSGASSSQIADGVSVEVYWCDAQRGTAPCVLLDQANASDNGSATNLTADLTKFAGQTGELHLVVNARANSGNDWLTWTALMITPRAATK